MLSRSLRDRISGLIRQGFAGQAPAPGSNERNGHHDHDGRNGNSGHNGHAPPGVPPAGAFVDFDRRVIPAGIEEILPGGVIEGPHGPIFAHERLYTDLGEWPAAIFERYEALCAPPIEAGDEDPAAGNGQHRPYDPAREPRVVYDPEYAATSLAPALDLPTMVARLEWPERGIFRRFGFRRMLFLDLETCGLTACPVFLAGVCVIGEDDLVLRQIFARDYTEERALIHEIARLMGEADFLVTFNGKTFDVPFLRDRAAHHRMAFPSSIPHLDLLWLARRRWKHTLPDCKLKTLEWRVLRRRRAGDVGGDEIPGLYHDYVQHGEAHRLVRVFHHNMLDVVAMVELIPPLFDPDAVVY